MRKNYMTVEVRLNLDGLRRALSTGIEGVLLRAEKNGDIKKENVATLHKALNEEVATWLDTYKTVATDENE